MTDQVSVVVGAGGIGSELAERLCADSVVVIADFRQQPMTEAATRVHEQGRPFVIKDVDVRNRASVRALAATAAGQGTVRRVVHTAGVSPTDALTEAILMVDMVGAAIVIEEFEQVIAPGGSAVMVAGVDGHLVDPHLIDPALEATILATRPEDLLVLPEVRSVLDGDAELQTRRAFAYGFAKRVNQLHVRAAAARWGRRGARINSLSPGDLGTPRDVADAVEFLLGPGSAYITGTDLLVDGGLTAAMEYPA